MDVHLLRTFVTVASRGSFSAAAVELGYTQAAISQQIAALESDLKVALLNRRPVTPTEAGARLLEHAAPILLRLDAARADVTRLTSAPAASLAIGVTPLSGAMPALGAALATLRQRMPRLDVTVQVSPRTEVATAVARGYLDIGLTDGLAAPSDPLPPLAPVSALGMTDTAVAVVFPEGHPLAKRPGIRLTDLVDARWIDAPAVAPPLADIRRIAGLDGFHPAFHYTGTDTATLLRLAAAGHGITILPATVAVLTGTDLTAVPLTTPRAVHRFELLHGSLRPASPAAVLTDILAPR